MSWQATPWWRLMLASTFLNMHIELSLALQDLWDDHHLELGRPDRVTPTEMERSSYGNLTLWV